MITLINEISRPILYRTTNYWSIKNQLIDKIILNLIEIVGFLYKCLRKDLTENLLITFCLFLNLLLFSSKIINIFIQIYDYIDYYFINNLKNSHQIIIL